MRLVVRERELVADLLAGVSDVRPDELVDEQLRAVARGVVACRPFRLALLDEDLCALARAQGVSLTGEECEQLRREGGIRRAA